MVFENVTLFEVHLDDAQFSADAGLAADADASDDDRRVDDEAAPRVDDVAVDEGAPTEGSSGRGRFVRLAAASVVVSVVATVVARRIAGRGDDPVEVDLDADRVRDGATDSDRADGPAVPSPDPEE